MDSSINGDLYPATLFRRGTSVDTMLTWQKVAEYHLAAKDLLVSTGVEEVAEPHSSTIKYIKATTKLQLCWPASSCRSS